MADALPALDELAFAVARLGDGADGRADRAWYDIAVGDDGQVACTLLDARAAPPAVAQELRRALADLGPPRSPAATLDGLDRAAGRIAGAAGAVALCVALDPAGVVRWSAAGHAPPSVVGPDGARALPGATGAPLGGAGRPPSAQEPLAAGATVVLDVARGRGAVDGTDPVAAVAARHQGLAPAALAAALEEALAGHPGCCTVLLARRMPAPLEQRLPADPRRLSAVRRTVAAWSVQAGLSEDATADLQLLLSEAATNAVEHAYRGTGGGEFVYAVRRRPDGGVRVTVQDFGRWRPPPDDPGYRGRGLAVIHNLAQEVELDHTDRGTRIAFTVPSDAPPLAQRPLAGVTQGWKPGSGTAP
jgi:anti-sigma regulatory factor (Ser/Thr protein kinase)